MDGILVQVLESILIERSYLIGGKGFVEVRVLLDNITSISFSRTSIKFIITIFIEMDSSVHTSTPPSTCPIVDLIIVWCSSGEKEKAVIGLENETVMTVY